MNSKRWLHGCGIFVYKRNFYAMVAGGYDDTGVLSSSEFWDITSNSGWIQGKGVCTNHVDKEGERVTKMTTTVNIEALDMW